MPLDQFPREKWRWKRVFGFLVGNALPLLLALYGMKCVVTLSGHLTEPNSKVMLRTFFLAPVEGMAAVVAGLGYISLAMFGYLSCGRPPDEDRKWTVRMLRAVVRWGSLGAAFAFWHQAHKLRLAVS
jgi:hypothetical protein